MTFSSVLQADAYARFNKLYRDGRITETACWAPARREIYYVHARTPAASTDEALERIGELYTIDAEREYRQYNVLPNVSKRLNHY